MKELLRNSRCRGAAPRWRIRPEYLGLINRGKFVFPSNGLA
jgi:hypothetical protein